MAKIQTIKNNEDVIIYPQTHTTAVFTDDGEKLQDKLEQYLTTEDIGELEEVAIKAELQTNKVTVVNADSTDTTYPSAKAVYEAIIENSGAGLNIIIPEDGTRPTEGEGATIYLIPAAAAETENIYEEWMYINSKWELIGTTAIDLSNYALRSLYGDNAINVGRAAGTASMDYSTAEGWNTFASATASHTEGFRSVAVGFAAHAEGGTDAAQSRSRDIVSISEDRRTVVIMPADDNPDERSFLGATIDPPDFTIYVVGESIDESTTQRTLTFNVAIPDTYVVGDGISLYRYNNIAYGDGSHAEGNQTTAKGEYSHSEGLFTQALGDYSHSENSSTRAIGRSSHAEGGSTIASGQYSHAEGSLTKAEADNSHTEGLGTIARSDYQHVQGKYNIMDTDGIFAHIVGNGSDDDNLSNAHALDWFGNAWFAGDVYVGSTSGTNKDDGSKKLATEEIMNTSLETTKTEVLNQVLTLTNTTEYTPTADYHPATKLYVDTLVGDIEAALTALTSGSGVA